MINLDKKTIGIDISDHTIQIVELSGQGGQIKVNRFGEEIITPGIVVNGRIKDSIRLGQALKNCLAKARLTNIGPWYGTFAVVPEAQVYIDISEIGLGEEANLKSKINKVIESTFPFNIEELICAHKIESRQNKNTKKLLIMGVRKKIIREWEGFFKRNELKVKVFDFEALATFRGLFAAWPEEPVGLLGIGASSTNFYIFDSAGLAYAYALPEAGNFFTKRIAEELKISADAAEEKKVEKGLSGDLSGASASAVLSGCLDGIFKEVNENIAYFEKERSQSVKKIYLYGGSSKIKGLKEYLLKQNFKHKIEVARPRLGPDNISQEYIGAIGAALRGIDNKWQELDPLIPATPASADRLKVFSGKLGAFKRLKHGYIIFFVTIILLIGAYFTFWAHNNATKEIPVWPSEANKEFLPAPPPPLAEEKPVEQKEQVRIKAIGANLNVREGAGTDYAIVGKAAPGEIFDLLEEKEGWYQIVLKSGQIGWVSSAFCDKIF